MKKKLKGFTLIELIVVLAIFGIVLAAATSLLQPVQKIMLTMDAMNSGNGGVSQISKYLEGSLGSAEYIHVAQFVPTDDEKQQMVDYFVDTYYSGILKNGASTSSKSYAKGKVHLMVIDNRNQGKISEYVYDCDLTPGKSAVLNTAESNEFAINRAIYDECSFTIYPGLKKYTADSSYDFNSFLINSGDVYQTSFTIDGQIVRHQGLPNEQKYDFSGSATVPLMNILKSTRTNGVPISTYFVYALGTDASGKNPGDAGYSETITDIVDKASVVRTGSSLLPVTYAGIAGNPNYGNKSTVTSVDQIKADGMCFIYSFGSEINTN